MLRRQKHVLWQSTTPFAWGEAFLLTVGAFLLAVQLLCSQSLKALIRRTFPL